METLAYLHLVLASQEGKPFEKSKPDNLGASWDNKAWDEIFEESEPTPDTLAAQKITKNSSEPRRQV